VAGWRTSVPAAGMRAIPSVSHAARRSTRRRRRAGFAGPGLLAGGYPVRRSGAWIETGFQPSAAAFRGQSVAASRGADHAAEPSRPTLAATAGRLRHRRRVHPGEEDGRRRFEGVAAGASGEERQYVFAIGRVDEIDGDSSFADALRGGVSSWWNQASASLPATWCRCRPRH